MYSYFGLESLEPLIGIDYNDIDNNQILVFDDSIDNWRAKDFDLSTSSLGGNPTNISSSPNPQATLYFDPSDDTWKDGDIFYTKQEVEQLVNGLEWQSNVIGFRNSPISSPNNKDRVVVGTSPSGDFSGHSNKIAEWNGSQWEFITPEAGVALYSEDDQKIFIYQESDNSWKSFLSVFSHGTLQNLDSDDHAQYVHNTNSRTISAQHTFNPSSSQSPFILGSNAQGQLVTGLNAELVNGNNIDQNLTTSSDVTFNSLTLSNGLSDDTSHGNLGAGSLHSVATTSMNGFMSSSDKSKLDNIENGATNISNLSDISNENISSSPSTGQIIMFDSTSWGNYYFSDSIHGNRGRGSLHTTATTSENGFMSSSDKSKLDNIENGATNISNLSDISNENINSSPSNGQLIRFDGSSWTNYTFTASDIGLGNVENIALSTANWSDMGISKSDVSKSDVGLGNVPNTDTTDASNITSGTLPNAQVSKSSISQYFGSESGSTTVSTSGVSTGSITFSNTYTSSNVTVGLDNNGEAYLHGFIGYNTDASGNITGFNFKIDNVSGNNQTVHWNIFGITT